MPSKSLRKIIREAEKQGWTVKATKNNHWRFYAPDGVNIVHASGTASDHRTLDNLLAQLKRYGFQWR